MSEKTITRKASRWLGEMSGMYMSLRFNARSTAEKTISTMLEGMIAIGDLAKTSDGMIRCVEKHTVTFAPGMAAIVGFNDPTIRQPDSAFVSGAVILLPSDNEPLEPAISSRPARTSDTPCFKTIDSLHERLVFNIGASSLRMPCRYWLEMISWPDYEHTKDTGNRIVRRELERQCGWLIERGR